MFDSISKINECDELKKELENYRPLTKEVVSQLKDYYKISLTYTSNAIEGNSLTESETKVVIEDGLTIGGKPMRDQLEAVGHANAYNFINDLAASKGEISEDDILKTHALFYEKIDKENAGKYRKVQVFVSGTDYLFPSPESVPQLMKEFVQSIPTSRKKLHPIEFAAWLHYRFVNIHPFVDGNGRVARLLMNLALLRASYVITIIPPVVRTAYIETISECQKSGDPKLFYVFISNMVWESLKDYLRLIKGRAP